jgi:parallel beta-helix repeat protein
VLSIPTNLHPVRIGKLFGTLFTGLCLAAIALGIALPYGSSAAGDSVVIKPEADTDVKSNAPTKDYGAASHLDVNTTLKLYLPLIMSKPVTPAPTGKVKILCENKVYDGYTSKLFVLETAEDQNPNIQKVIRNCTFRNGSEPALVLRSARNVLVEGSTFENIRSNQPGVGVHAINIPCRAPCLIDNVVIRNNHFSMIGADGIQLGEEDRNISNVRIENNTFVGREGSGENGVDVKGANGPIFIVGNVIYGFRPCVSPKQGGIQDCSGSTGAGLVIHEGVPAGRASNVTVEGNEFYDNTDGIRITDSDNITVQNNSFHDNLEYGLLASEANKLTISGNTFADNGTNMDIQNSADCSAPSNTFSGSGGTGSFGPCIR